MDISCCGRRRRNAALGLAAMVAVALTAGTASSASPEKRQSPARVGLGWVSGSVSGTYLAARHAESLGDFKAAADLYVRLLDVTGGDPQMRRRAFVSLAAAGRLDAAAELAPRVSLDGEAGFLAALLTVVDEMSAGRIDEGLAHAEALPDDGLARIVGPLVRAWLLFEAEGPDAALESIAGLDGISAAAPIRSFHRALVLDLAGRAEAEEAYRRALDASERPSIRVYQAFAGFLARQGRGDESRQMLERFRAGNPDSDLLGAVVDSAQLNGQPERPLVGSIRDGLAEALFGVAGSLTRRHEAQNGLIYARYALRLVPELHLARFLMGDMLAGMGHYEEAIAAYRTVPSDGPFAWQALLRSAETLSSAGRNEEAAQVFEQMAADRAADPDPLFRLGNLMREDERYAEAVEAYDRAFARLGEPGPADWALLYARGIALERTRQWPRAEADLLRALEYRPEHPYVLNYLGYSWADQGKNLDRARDMIERAVALRPTDGFIVDSLGWVLYREGRFQDAVVQLERAVELRPGDPVINDHLGDAYWQVGRKHEARFQWRRALSFKPEAGLEAVIEQKLLRGLHAPVEQRAEQAN